MVNAIGLPGSNSEPFSLFCTFLCFRHLWFNTLFLQSLRKDPLVSKVVVKYGSTPIRALVIARWGQLSHSFAKVGVDGSMSLFYTADYRRGMLLIRHCCRPPSFFFSSHSI